MSKGFWAIIAIIAIIFGGILLFKSDNAGAPSNGAQPTNHVIGNNTKGVVLVEYGDFECAFCGQYHPMVKEVVAKYENDIQFQFRNLPLQQNHKNAFAAARAAEAAGLQNKYWGMYDLLFQNQSAWAKLSDAVPVFEQFATQLGLNMEQYKTDFGSEKVNDLINADIAEFKKTKEAVSTPTFFLDGKKITPKSLDEFSKLIDEAIAKKNQ